MGTPRRSSSRALIGALLALALAGPARATLGESEASVERDRAATAMTRRAAVARGAVAVHELRSEGVSVRQFASPEGTIFAVAWSGSLQPDLDTLLGAHAKAFRAAAAQPRRARGPRRVVAGPVTVEFWGHGRALHGRAYLKDAIPGGVSLDELQ